MSLKPDLPAALLLKEKRGVEFWDLGLLLKVLG